MSIIFGAKRPHNNRPARQGGIMAEVVMMRHPQTGEIKKGFMGFSWTVFFWAWIPMLCRKDWMMGLPYLLLQTLYLFVTIGHYDSEYSLVSFLAQLGFAFSYNKRMSGIHLAIPVFSKGYRPKQGKVAP